MDSLLLNKFEAMCWAVGSDATETQVQRLVDFVSDNFGTDNYPAAMHLALDHDVANLFPELSMLAGEAGGQT